MVSGTILRVFGCRDSWYRVQNFVVTGSRSQELLNERKGLGAGFKDVTLLNTDSNLINTDAQALTLKVHEEGKRKRSGTDATGGDATEATKRILRS